MLKSAGASEQALKEAKEHKCSVCIAQKPPGMHPVVNTHKDPGFNQVVSLDTFDIHLGQVKKIKMLNICCEGTGLQVVVPLWRGASSHNTRKAYRKFWLRWAGCPPRIKTDGGPEFDGEFQEGCDRDNTYVSKSAAESPWQQGFCERQGGLWKQIFYKAKEDSQPRSREEFNELFDKVTESKNSMARRHGYSPYQHVFGNDLKVAPGLLDNSMGEHVKSGIFQGVNSFVRAQEIRQSARKAMASLDDVENVRKAVQKQTRAPTKPFEVGEYVYYWRRSAESKQGIWKGPARVIGTYNANTKIWVNHGNKVLRCSPQQLKLLTEDQKKAVGVVPAELLAVRPSSKRGAQVFTDISQEAHPQAMDLEEENEDEPQREAKRQRVSFETDMEETDQDAEARPGHERQVTVATEQVDTQCPNTPQGTIPDSDENQQQQRTSSQAQVTASAGTDSGVIPWIGNSGTTPAGHGSSEQQTYGPVRRESLTHALRRSADILDHGDIRLPRSQLAPHPQREEDDALIAQHSYSEKMKEKHEFQVNEDGELEVFLVQKDTQEVTDRELSPFERLEVDKGKLVEWEKLLKTGAIRMHEGEEATKVLRDHPQERILESRFVKTRRDHPDKPGEKQIKCRWCIKGFRDPDLYEVDRQSPTLSLDALMVCLQIIASKKWTLIISDVEGAFLQGDPLVRSKGKIFVKLPQCGVPGYSKNSVAELVKCVYGLCDAPRSWWLSFSKTLQDLGMKQSELDPCVYFWYNKENGEQLEGVIALHVDDMVIGGSDVFHEKVLSLLKQRYPFKHWKLKQGKFLGRMLKQDVDGSICCDQKEYAENVETIKLTKERRKQKDEPVTPSEKKRLRGVVGAANWLMGSTRPDIAVEAGLLQQRIQNAKVSDLIEANRLVSKIRDHSHVQITIRSIPLEQGSFMVATDASWCNLEDLKSQAGYFTFFGTKQMLQGGKTFLSPLRWKSFKQERHTQSTLGAELMALARGISEANWLRSLLGEALHKNYCLEKDRRYREVFPLCIVIDNRPIFDHVVGDGVVIKDKRMAVDMLIVRRDIREENICLRWVETSNMIADVLTKPGVSLGLLFNVLRSGWYLVNQMNLDPYSPHSGPGYPWLERPAADPSDRRMPSPYGGPQRGSTDFAASVGVQGAEQAAEQPGQVPRPASDSNARMQELRRREEQLRQQQWQEEQRQRAAQEQYRLQEQKLQEQREQEQRLQEQRLQEQRLQEQRMREQQLQPRDPRDPRDPKTQGSYQMRDLHSGAPLSHLQYPQDPPGPSAPPQAQLAPPNGDPSYATHRLVPETPSSFPATPQRLAPAGQPAEVRGVSCGWCKERSPKAGLPLPSSPTAASATGGRSPGNADPASSPPAADATAGAAAGQSGAARGRSQADHQTCQGGRRASDGFVMIYCYLLQAIPLVLQG
eukprot:s192_g40.t1